MVEDELTEQPRMLRRTSIIWWRICVHAILGGALCCSVTSLFGESFGCIELVIPFMSRYCSVWTKPTYEARLESVYGGFLVQLAGEMFTRCYQIGYRYRLLNTSPTFKLATGCRSALIDCVQRLTLLGVTTNTRGTRSDNLTALSSYVSLASVTPH